MRSFFLLKKPLPLVNAILGRSGQGRRRFPRSIPQPQADLKAAKTIKVTRNVALEPIAIHHNPPQRVAQCWAVTIAPSSEADSTMEAHDDADKSPSTLLHEGFVKFCVNMDNNRFVEQWVTLLVYI